MNLTDLLGTVGVFMILLAYFLSSAQKISSFSKLYSWLNLLGATLACIASVMLHYVPFIVLEALWMVVAAVSLLRKVPTSPH